MGTIPPCPAKEIVLGVSGALLVQVLRILARNYQEKDSAQKHMGSLHRPGFSQHTRGSQPGMDETLFLTSCEAHWGRAEGRAPSATPQNVARLAVLKRNQISG